jgi:hypothetical protein
MPSTALDEAAQVDRVGHEKNWFMPEPKGLKYQTILAYMSGSLTVEAAINAIAEPIDHAWSNPRVRPGMETDEDSDFVSVEGSL